MTEREEYLFNVMKHCVLEEDFCDNCVSTSPDYDGCKQTHSDFFKMIKDAFAQRDALLADLNLACGGKFVDVCCICGHYTPEHPGERCELKGLDCRWVWRGVQK